jgi:hypothetical protein
MIYIKRYDRLRPVSDKKHHGLNSEESYRLELSALDRLKGCENMCQLLDYDLDNLTLTLKWAGNNINYYGDQRKAIKRWHKQQHRESVCPSFDLTLTEHQLTQQLDNIFKTLEMLNIVHFDLGPWNFCVKDNYLTLIDFGCVVLDGCSDSIKLKDQYNSFLANGAWANQKILTEQRLISKLY